MQSLTKLALLLVFSLCARELRAQSTASSDTTVYSEADTLAYFPGGQRAWNKFLLKTLRYPDAGVNERVQGDITVQFIVEADGQLSEIQAMTGPLEGGLRKEAERIIRISGKWIPAMVGGKVVRSYKRQLIRFKLSFQ
jgi:protein TonB